MGLNQSQDLGAVFILCFVIALLCLIARVTSRQISGVGLKVDDYSYILGVVCLRIVSTKLDAHTVRTGCCRGIVRGTDDIWFVFPAFCLAVLCQALHCS